MRPASSLGGALDALRATDVRLRDRFGPLGSLAPGRKSATPLVEIAERLFARGATTPGVALEFARALCDLAEVQADSFPGNLFWDFDFAASRLFSAIAASGKVPATAGRVSTLQRTFGRALSIRFRYAHDFTYGFDWARWVARDPGARSAIGPLDAAFVDHMCARGEEILGLISRNDVKYPPLPEGALRNPFGFSREPADETRLHRDLAERGLIPVEAWRFEPAPTAVLPYADLREERARALGLAR